MTVVCNAAFNNDVGGRLESKTGIYYNNNMNCTYTIHAGTSKRMLLIVNRFD